MLNFAGTILEVGQLNLVLRTDYHVYNSTANWIKILKSKSKKCASFDGSYVKVESVYPNCVKRIYISYTITE